MAIAHHANHTMNGAPSIEVLGTGAYLPSRILTNDDLARLVDTSDEWIVARTGIRERRIAAEDETTSGMAVAACRQALEAADLKPDQVDLLIVATITPDMLFPSTACLIQTGMGMRKIAAFDVEAACSGFLYVLEIGAAMVRSGAFRNALVVGAEKLSSIIDWEDRSTCVLFGDGAGAVVLGATERPGTGLIGSLLGADGAGGDILAMPGGGTAIPATMESVQQRQHFLKMNGKEVFKVAVRVMEQTSEEILERHGIEAKDVALVVPHQANMRIIEMLSQRLAIPIERFAINIERLGNTSAASIPIVLDEAVRGGKIRSGDLILLVAFGAGLTWASTLIRWP